MQQGDIGAPIRFHLVQGYGEEPFVLVDGAEVELWIRKPSQTLVKRGFTITDPTEGEVYYETVDGDIDEVGKYRFQARAVLPEGARIAFAPKDETIGANIFPAAYRMRPTPAVVTLDAPAVGLS